MRLPMTFEQAVAIHLTMEHARYAERDSDPLFQEAWRLISREAKTARELLTRCDLKDLPATLPRDGRLRAIADEK